MFKVSGLPHPKQCRGCGAEQDFVPVCDLGKQPLANQLLNVEQLSQAEAFYPLQTWLCQRCFLLQLPEVATPQHIFSDYPYFSSFSSTFVEQARVYTEQMQQRLSLHQHSQVVEVASNDGYLLQHFVEQKIPVLGVEPAANVAAVAQQRGIDTKVGFFGLPLAQQIRHQQGPADLLIANNVLAHVPDLQDFVAGLAHLLAPQGILTVEFPQLLNLLQQLQFDTIYHEHFSYFSVTSAQEIFARHGLFLFDVESLPSHGGSVRLFLSLDDGRAPSAAMCNCLAQEQQAGLQSTDKFVRFQQQLNHWRLDFWHLWQQWLDEGKRIVGYGAAAKASTLLNFAGVSSQQLLCVADANPSKQQHWLPGCQIPIVAPEMLRDWQPDLVWVLPWNIRDEIAADIRRLGIDVPLCSAIPRLEVFT